MVVSCYLAPGGTFDSGSPGSVDPVRKWRGDARWLDVRWSRWSYQPR